jgi:hypothetical protein
VSKIEAIEQAPGPAQESLGRVRLAEPGPDTFPRGLWEMGGGEGSLGAREMTQFAWYFPKGGRK